MLKIALIDLDYANEELNEPLGIESLAASLEILGKENVIVKMACLQIPGTDYRPLLSDFKPHIIGLSTKIGSLCRIGEIIAYAKGLAPERPPLVVLGGPLATLEAEALLGRFEKAICIIGEGEETWVALARFWLGTFGEEMEPKNIIEAGITNLALKLNDRVVRTRRKVIHDLGILPLPRRDFLPDIVSRRGLVRAETSRGCPWNRCSFCILEAKYAGEGWRPFEPGRVVRDLENLSDLGADLVYFTDEEFVAGGFERVYEICSLLGKAKKLGTVNPKMKFYASAGVRAILGKRKGEDTAKLLRALREAGFLGFFIGLESGSRTQLARYGKGVTVAENHSVIRAFKESGLELDLGFIMFDPKTTLEELIENLIFLNKADLLGHDSSFTKRMRVWPGTRVFERVVKDYHGNFVYEPGSEGPYLPFKDWKVESVFQAFKLWEEWQRKKINKLQGDARGLALEADRIQLKREIGRVRARGLSLLCDLVEAVQKATGPEKTPFKVDLTLTF